MNSVSIIPKPNHLNLLDGSCKVPKNIKIITHVNFHSQAEILKNFLNSVLNCDIVIETQKDTQKETQKADVLCINIEKIDGSQATFSSSENKSHIEGNYVLQIEKERILILSRYEKGVFYAIQSLRQLFPPSLAKINIINKKEIPKENKKDMINFPCLKITDAPRFSWRGLMVDEGRWFLGKEAIKKVLDYMALLKLNKFHWHLTEDQGWRLEIEEFPKLTEIGSKRSGSPKSRHMYKISNDIPHQGYYSQEDVKEIISYAKERYIEIIPEIELPGHSQAALAAYPYLGCKEKQYDVSTRWGVHKDVYCLGNPKTINFLKEVLDEVVELFPSDFVHIGGDEVPKKRWKNCPKCQQEIKNLGLKDEQELQLYYTNYFIDYLHQKGKRSIVWNDEVVQGLDKNAVCQFWRGNIKHVHSFIEKGGKLIISPSNRYYLDISYHYTPLKQTYKYKPVPNKWEQDLEKNILGLEGEMWGEVITSLNKLEWNIFPRLLAIAESAWTHQKNKNYALFKKSVKKFLNVLKNLGINHAKKETYSPSWLKRMFLKLRKGYYD